MNRIVGIIFGFALFTACSSGPSKEAKAGMEVDSIKTEAMRIHDEIMPDMGKLEYYTNYIEEKLETHPQDSVELKEILLDLKTADKSMWEWMYNYKKDTQASLAIQKAYYQSQLEGIKVVDDKMRTSIEQAKNYSHEEN